MRRQEHAKRVVESTFEHFGKLDILVNAAAGNFLVSAEDLSPNGFRTGSVFRMAIIMTQQKSDEILTLINLELNTIFLLTSAVMDIDSVGTFTMCHEALKYLKNGGPGRSSSGGGSILNISATLHYTASWYQIHVAAAKVCCLHCYLQASGNRYLCIKHL